MSERMKNIAALGGLRSDTLAVPAQPVPEKPKAPVRVEVKPASGLDTTTLGQPLPIKLSRVSRFEGQPRRYFNSDALEQLADSIQKTGQEQPVKVCIDNKSAGNFLLIDGERRWRAHHIIQDRTGKEPTILAFIETVKDVKDHFRKSVIANLHREDLASLDEAAALARLQEEGESIESLAELVGKSRMYVDNYIRVHSLPDAVKALMDPNLPKDRRLNITQAIEIARSTRNELLRMELAKEAVDRSMSISETRYLIANKVGYSSEPSTYVNAGRPRNSAHSGFKRPPMEVYRQYTGNLTRMETTAKSILQSIDIESVYSLRQDETGSREKDAATIANTISSLQELLKKVRA